MGTDKQAHSPRDAKKRKILNSVERSGPISPYIVIEFTVNDARTTELEDLLPTRQSLLSRLRDWNDQQSWRIFFETYWKLIYKAGRKAGLTDAEAQDVVQETVISVCRNIPSFHYDPEKGSFRAWLLRVTTWRINDELRKRNPVAQPARAVGAHPSDRESAEPLAEQLADPAGSGLEELWNAEWESNLIEAATQRVKNQVDARHYQVFDCYVLKEWPIARVIQTFRISRAQLYLIKHRIGRLIKQEIEQLRTQPL